MKNSIQLLFLLLLIGSNNVQAQTSLQGKVTEQDSGEPILFGTVALYKNDVVITGVETDFDGNYNFSNIDPGTYDVEVAYVGLQTQRIEDVVVFAGKANQLNIQLSAGGVSLEEVVVVDYKVPLIEKDNMTSGATTTLPTRSINNLPNRRPAIKSSKRQKNKDKNLTMRGSRSESTDYYIDGIRVRGNIKQSKKKQRVISKEERFQNSKIQDTNIQEHSREGYDAIVENTFLEVDKNPLSTFSIDVDAAAYSNMRRFINMGQLPPADAVRIEELVNYFDYDYPSPKDDVPFEVITEISDCPWQSENKLLHIGLQGQKMKTEDLAPSNIVFLIDVSGSMGTANKLPLLKSSFKLLTAELRPQDQIAIVVYAGSAGLVLPSTKGSDKATILAALDQLKSGGSTAGGQGIKLAYKTAREHFIEGGNNRVILATDGDFNVGTSSDGELVSLIEKERESNIFLTVLGFGMGNYQDAKMQKLADSGNGNHAYIDNINEAKKVLVNEFGGTLFTIAKDVKLQLEFNPTKVAAYRLVGYENRMLAAEDFNDDKKDAGELGAGHTVTALYEIIPAGTESAYIREVDKLKYQKTKTKTVAAVSDEMLTIKLRYKAPEGKESKLIEKTVRDQQIAIDKTSDNFRFSAAVASFGMLLRSSAFKGNASYKQSIDLAKGAVGQDVFGYRKECVELMEITQKIDTRVIAKK